jgi:hypothetical protein
MILTEQEYSDIVAACKVFIDQNQFPDQCDCSLPNVDFDTLQSIFGQIYVRHTKKVSFEVEKEIHTIAKVRYGNTLFAVYVCCNECDSVSFLFFPK